MLSKEQSILSVNGLSHRYSKGWAIFDLNFEIRGNGVMGLLGSNGAGKSTTMNILCGVLSPTAGHVLINGIDITKDPIEAKKNIGFLPQIAPLYMDLTVDEYLSYCAHLRQVETSRTTSSLKKVKEQCGLLNIDKRLIKNLSGGYKQRVGIAQAIIHQPKLVVLDEPTNGLDPNQIYEVRNLIKEIGKERAIIFSSHILSEVQATCKDIRMIEQGRVVFSGTMEDFNNRVEPRSLLLTLKNMPPGQAFTKVKDIIRVEQVSECSVRLYFSKSDDITERIIEQSVHSGWKLQEITLEKSSLEDVFAQLSGNRIA